MTRRRWLVAYDIADPRRLRQVHDIVRSYGTALQLSVFLCDLDTVERYRLLTDLRPVIHHHEDSILLVDLGEPDRPHAAKIDFLGRPPRLPPDQPRIV